MCVYIYTKDAYIFLSKYIFKVANQYGSIKIYPLVIFISSTYFLILFMICLFWDYFFHDSMLSPLLTYYLYIYKNLQLS